MYAQDTQSVSHHPIAEKILPQKAITGAQLTSLYQPDDNSLPANQLQPSCLYINFFDSGLEANSQ
ncbi:hypothetical protein J6590_101879, partial [Homalodisca vitripennis]